jgi:aminopeptidase N
MPCPAYVEGKKVMCMSLYGKEAYNLYRKYSTKAVAHTIKTYSKFTIPYPYPVAQSVEASSGMEYPMICFNYGRTNDDGSYSEDVKYGMLGVIIHEVGHNFFPMIINSDERQWAWMDEGLNSFVQYLTQELFDDKFPSRRGPAWAIVDYMKLPKNQLEPIMTNADNITQLGPNAYAKPATALTILRETIMGRKLFDAAFKEYARRWAFKHPTPADLFRTLEDASAEDLDWFWRGWFYSTDACDISLDSVRYATVDVNTVPMQRDTMVHLAKPLVNAFEDILKDSQQTGYHKYFQR